MSLLFFLKGLLIGLSISAPVGPMALLCIRRTLTGGRAAGLATGCGVATADGMYSAMAAFGMAAIAGLLQDHRALFRFASAGILCLFGARIFCSKTPDALPTTGLPAKKWPLLYGSALLLALSNPLGILFFTAVVAGTGLADTGGNYVAASFFVLGVASGSLAWWCILSTGVALLGARLSPRMFVLINRASGLLIALFGVLMLFSGNK